EPVACLALFIHKRKHQSRQFRMFVVQQTMSCKMDNAIFSKDSTHGRRTACLKIQRLKAFSHGDDRHHCVCFVASVDQTIEMNCSIPSQSQISSSTSEFVAA